MVSRPAASIAATQVVQGSRALGVQAVGIHRATREQPSQDLRILQEVGAAAVDDRRDAGAGGDQSADEIALAQCRRGGEHATTAGVGGSRVRRDAAHDFVVLVQPHQVVAIEHAAAFQQPGPDRWRLRCVGGRAGGVDVSVGVGAAIEQQIDQREVAAPGGRMERCAARTIGAFRPRGIRAAIEQEADEVVVAERDRGGQWTPAVRPRLAAPFGRGVQRCGHV
jgi:hypothetical protein